MPSILRVDPPRTANFHEETIHSFLEMIAASGLQSPSEIRRKHINKRAGISKVVKKLKGKVISEKAIKMLESYR